MSDVTIANKIICTSDARNEVELEGRHSPRHRSIHGSVLKQLCVPCDRKVRAELQIEMGGKCARKYASRNCGLPKL